MHRPTKSIFIALGLLLALGQAHVFFARALHCPIRQAGHWLCAVDAFALDPRVENVDMIAGAHRAHRVRLAPVNMVKLREDRIAPGLRFTLEQRQERTPVLTVGTWQANRLEQCRQQTWDGSRIPKIFLLQEIEGFSLLSL